MCAGYDCATPNTHVLRAFLRSFAALGLIKRTKPSREFTPLSLGIAWFIRNGGGKSDPVSRSTLTLPPEAVKTDTHPDCVYTPLTFVVDLLVNGRFKIRKDHPRLIERFHGDASTIWFFPYGPHRFGEDSLHTVRAF